MNRWCIPPWLEGEVLERDRARVYCRTPFGPTGNRRERPSWKHIINDANVVNRENIVLCCIDCNASKGAKSLATWLQSPYCVSRGITATSVANVVQAALDTAERAAA